MCDRKIWKYKLVNDVNTIALPSDHSVLGVYPKGNTVCIWIEMSDAPHDVERTFRIRRTGGKFKMSKRGEYLATCALPCGLVWHIFDMGVDYVEG